jgi:hypothetical protein
MRRPTDLIFQLEHQFTLYLQRCKVSRADLGVEQLREMRRAFYGGLGQMFFLITQDVADLKERDQIITLELFQKGIGEFWEEELKMQRAGMENVHATTPCKCECGWIGQVKDLILPTTTGELCKCPKCQSVNLYYKP